MSLLPSLSLYFRDLKINAPARRIPYDAAAADHGCRWLLSREQAAPSSWWRPAVPLHGGCVPSRVTAPPSPGVRPGSLPGSTPPYRWSASRSVVPPWYGWTAVPPPDAAAWRRPARP